MLRVRSITRSTLLGFGCALLLVLPSAPASAAAIDLSLNVLYANPANATSGGTWELVAKTNADGFGLFGLKALLTNILTAQNTAPRGIVNSTDPAGFAIFGNNPFPAGYNDITFGQAPIVPPPNLPREQSVFYGVGTLTNGAPNYPGKPMDAMFEGPAFISLTGVNGVPWAATNTFNNPAWATAAKLATGTFAAGVTPGFYANGSDVSRGNTFTALGTSMNYGTISAETIIASTIVRTNLMQSADYNHNGIVDAADYVVWRSTLGSMTMLDADGNNNLMIDPGDYDVWKEHFGTVPGAGAALGAAAVPEPSGLVLLVIGAAFTFRRGARRNTSPFGRGERSIPVRGPYKTYDANINRDRL